MNDKVEDSIASTFDLAPMIVEDAEIIESKEENFEIIEQENNPESIQNEDLDYIRKNIKVTIDKGQKVLDDFIEIAKQGQSAREFEVVATLMKTIVDANDRLSAFTKQKKELNKNDSGEDKGPKTVNNTLVMTTESLQRMLENVNNGKDKD